MSTALTVVALALGGLLAAGLFIAPVAYWAARDRRDAELIDAYQRMCSTDEAEVSGV